MNKMDVQTWKAARRALEKAFALHLNDPNVSHIDLGHRVLSSAGHRLTSELAVRVHVRRKLHGKAFEAFAARHPERVIDAARLGFAVDIIQSTYDLDRRTESAALPDERPASSELRDLPHVFHNLTRHDGVCGGIVRDRRSGEEMLLSTWHTLAGLRQAKSEKVVYQPREAEENEQSFQAELIRHAMDVNLDAALARLEGSRLLLNAQRHPGAAAGTAIPQIGMKVVKSNGETGEATSGIITGILGCGIHLYDGVPRAIGHIVHIAPEERGKTLCAPGDSGSWWLEYSTRRAVALHFASSITPHFALALSMPEVLTALEADLVIEEMPHPRPVLISTASSAAPVTKTPPDRTLQPAHPTHRTRPLPKIVCAAVLAICLVAAGVFGFRLNEAHLQRDERLGRLQNKMQQLQNTAQLDSTRRHCIGKTLVIIDRFNPRMDGVLKVRIADEIYVMSRKYRNLEADLICATITQEAGWKPRAISHAQALGLMQILPNTGIDLAQEEGIAWNSAEETLFDPIHNIRLGCRYLAGLVRDYDIDAGLAAYNGGKRRAEQWVRQGRAHGILHEETAAYGPAVLKIFE